MSDLVVVSYHDLVAFSLDHPNHELLMAKVGRAFGSSPDCLGILAVSDVPLVSIKRQRLLPLARELALLPDKSEIISESSHYQMGWSHGKEMFAGQPDLAKGSFYANPLINDVGKHRNIPKHIQRDNPSFYAPNVWPHSTLPDLEEAFRDLGKLVWHVGCLLARVCDAYIAQQVNQERGHSIQLHSLHVGNIRFK